MIETVAQAIAFGGIYVAFVGGIYLGCRLLGRFFGVLGLIS